MEGTFCTPGFIPSKEATIKMKFIGLLTDEQKHAGYFVTQDEDCVYLFHRNTGNPRLVAVFDYEAAKIKEVRDKAEDDLGQEFPKL